MAEFIVDFVELNETINYVDVLIAIGIYLASIWVVISIWALFDARRRYKKNIFPIFWFIAILVLSVPALILYLIIRPEDFDWDTLFLDSNSSNPNDVLVPITQLPNGGRLLISLELNSVYNNTNYISDYSDKFRNYFNKQNFLRHSLLG